MRNNKLLASVDLPSQSEVQDRLLHTLGMSDRPMRPSEIYGLLADQFGLSAVQRAARRRDRDEPAWNNRVQFARRRLVDSGDIDNSHRGIWVLTPQGRATELRKRRTREAAYELADQLGL
ncbi:winged helix-turn-helix domain-containing protein [Parvibaculum sp.]|uniref:winged helix-turn-helix domain-containing protein n=1 Tax=Parvibaculum sp. TaxID=2024848 RepID=UPI001DA837B1|nr:winged helix-turn-helix domain-containing protein [Parvibaculum sp.]MCW5728225.1 winged helix-turn-helix domain-containing protein [Parvibaculum sp.]